ncbi:MAG: CRISPR-associated endonuclease Cas2 [Myxococcales bacterium]|nr:CRISPR-associated endonuclease Cas2 [Myxococcales bacterium]
MYLVLCYDVVSDARRDRLHRKLKGYLRPVQKSVFEGHLPDARYPRLLSMVDGTIDPTTDTVRVYHLCRGCIGRMDLIGTAEPLPPGDTDVVV